MNKEYRNKELLAKKYNELRSMKKVADYYGVSKKLILNYMNRFNIPRFQRPPAKPKIKKEDTYHKGYITTWNGYIKVKAPIDHPYKDKKGYIMQHRLIMEQSIGRYLEPYEEVHHIDYNKQNNNLSNLMLVTKTEHRRIHLQDTIHPVKI